MALVVMIAKITFVLPLPLATWIGMKLQVLSAGKPEQDKGTLLGKAFPSPAGSTSRLYFAICPAGIVTGLVWLKIVKSNVALEVTVSAAVTLWTAAPDVAFTVIV